MLTREQVRRQDEQLTQEEERELKSLCSTLRMMNAEARIDRICAQLEADGLLNVDIDALRRQKREERRREAMQFMASRPPVRRPVKRSTPRYSTKARVEITVIDDCYELKKKLPLSVQKRFQAEYNGTPYGQEQALIDKYTMQYGIR